MTRHVSLLFLILLLPCAARAHPLASDMYLLVDLGYANTASVLRVSTTETDQEVISGCVDSACTVEIGSGHSIGNGDSGNVGPPSITFARGYLWVRDGTTLKRVDPATGDRVDWGGVGRSWDLTTGPEPPLGVAALPSWCIPMIVGIFIGTGLRVVARGRASS